MPVSFVRLTSAVPPLWPAGTVLLVAQRDKASDLRWVCPDMSTGSAILVDQTFIQQLLAIGEPWTGNFPGVLSNALNQTSGCKKCKEAKHGSKSSIPVETGTL